MQVDLYGSYGLCHLWSVGVAVLTLLTLGMFLINLPMFGSKTLGSSFFLFSREPQLYKGVCPSVSLSVRPSVRPSIRLSVHPSVGWSVLNLFFLAGRSEDGGRLMPCIRPCLLVQQVTPSR